MGIEWVGVGRAMLANASNLTNRRHRLFEAAQPAPPAPPSQPSQVESIKRRRSSVRPDSMHNSAPGGMTGWASEGHQSDQTVSEGETDQTTVGCASSSWQAESAIKRCISVVDESRAFPDPFSSTFCPSRAFSRSPRSPAAYMAHWAANDPPGPGSTPPQPASQPSLIPFPLALCLPSSR